MKKAEPPSAEIQDLWALYRETRAPEIRDKIVEKYLPLVNIIAGRVVVGLPAHVDRDDLVSSGFFGLLDAIERYDVERGNKLSKRQKIRRYEQAVTALEGRLGRSATDDELAAELKISKKELHDLVSQTNIATVIPLEEYVRTESPSSQTIDPEENAEKNELRDTLAEAIDQLPEKERTVVSLYYYEELTLKEISLILHLSEARISQLHTKAVFRLRGFLARWKTSLME